MNFIKQEIAKLLSFIPDKTYLSIIYFIRMKKRLNWSNPVTFNEKLQWLKIYYRNPLYTYIVDKFTFKEYVKEKIGEQYIIPTIGCYNDFSEIDIDSLPDKFVMKCTHDSGSTIICHNKKTFDFKNAYKKLNRCMKYNLYFLSREWPYKNVKPKIMIENYLEMKNKEEELLEYKLFCFYGKVEIILIYRGEANTNERRSDFYNMRFEHLPIKSSKPNSNINVTKPYCFEELVEISKKLSYGMPHVRVDAYIVNNKIYIGELTFYHSSGLRLLTPEEWDYKLGSLLVLPKKM